MNLAIDIGNSRAKIGLFSKNSFEVIYDFTTEQIVGLLKEKNVQNVILCSVGSSLAVWRKILGNYNTIELSHTTPIPIENAYLTPKTLGMDRIASVIGATTISDKKNILVIDAGTCITFDYLKNDEYQGGAISPGIQIKLKALHNFTEKLPLVSLGKSVELIGKNTKDSIASGVLNGSVAEINSTIEEYTKLSDNLAVFLCGGDANLLSKSLKNIDFVEQELVLLGLNKILNYNVK